MRHRARAGAAGLACALSMGATGLGASLPQVPDRAPTAAFLFACTVLTCSFDGTISTDDVGIASWEWDFGNGVVATGATPTVSYETPGAYTVRLRVVDTAGQDHAFVQSVPVVDPDAPVDEPPTASFTHTCAEMTCTFDGRASTDDGGVTYYEWNLGNGSFPLGPLQTVTYAAPGTYSVGLRVGDAAGQLDVAFREVRVGDAAPPADDTAPPPEAPPSHETRPARATPPAHDAPPTAAFTWSCEGLTCTFDGRGSTDDRGIALWEWNLGNGTYPRGPVQTVTYGAAGTYRVGLQVADAAGQSDLTFHQVTVRPGT